MNIINSLIAVLVLAVLIAIGYKVGQIALELNSPPIPTSVNTAKFTLPQEQPVAATLRWNHFPLTVYLDTSFVQQKAEYINDFRQALELWQSTTNNLASFFVTTSSNVDITVEWTPSLKEKSLDTLGNTDIRFVNISGVGLIQNAEIQLLTKSDSKQLNDIDMVNLALHEIGHALGLQHDENENSIMYPILVLPSKAIKKISSEEIQKLQEIYAIKPNPDLRILEVNVSKATVKRFATTFNLVNVSLIIENIGLTDATSPYLQINADGIKEKYEILPDIPVGNKLSVILGNLVIENNFKTIQIVIDPNNTIEELNEENNFAILNVSQ